MFRSRFCGGGLRRPSCARPRAQLRLRALELRALPATFVVINNGASGAGSLRQAVLDANAATGQDAIVFDPALSGKFGSGFTVTGDLVILGTPGANLSVGYGGNIFDVADGVRFRIDDLTLANAKVGPGFGPGGQGGALAIGESTVTLNRVTLTGNSAFGSGGAVALKKVKGTLIAVDCVFQGNTANTGGAIYVSQTGPSVTLTRCTVSGNTSIIKGGAVYFNAGGGLTIDGSTLANNTAGGSGGAIWGWNPLITITNSTLSGNVSQSSATISGGGAIMLAGTPALFLRNSTLTGNQAAGFGGGIRRDGGYVQISSSIIAGNAAGSGGPDIHSATPMSLAGNNSLIGIANAGNVIYTGTLLSGTSELPFDPKLGPLANNGGGTLTHALLAGSAAVDKGNNNAFVSTDQRGTGHPRVLGLRADIGAFESDLNVPAGRLTTAPTVTAAGATAYDFVVTYSDGQSPIDRTTLKTGNLVVNGPGGFQGTPVFLSDSGPGTSVNATYRMSPPGNSWDFFDIGDYTVSVAGPPNAVFDTDPGFPNPVPSGPIGVFSVAIAGEHIVDEASDIDDGNYQTGHLSLREAVALSNLQTNTPDTISFDPDVFAVPTSLKLAAGTFKINGPVTITGPAAGLTLDAQAVSRHFTIDGPGVRNIVQLSGMTLINGKANKADGGSILLLGDALTLRNMTLSGNTAVDGSGGAISAQQLQATLELIDSDLSNNYAQKTVLTIRSGGAIHAASISQVVVRQSILANNRADSQGGGLFANDVDDVLIERSIISGNSAGAGGGLWLADCDELLLDSSTLAENTAAGIGGGVAIKSALLFSKNTTVRNCTITGNSAAGKGSGMYLRHASGKSMIENCTIVFNVRTGLSPGDDAALWIGGAPSLTISSSILAVNKASGNFPDINAGVGVKVSGNDNLFGVYTVGLVTLTGVNNPARRPGRSIRCSRRSR